MRLPKGMTCIFWPGVLSFLYYPLHFSRLFLKWGVRPDRKFLDD